MNYKDYRMCFEAMNPGHDNDRAYLAKKYNRPINNLADLYQLGHELFGKLSEKERSDDFTAVNKELLQAAAALGRKGGSVKSDKKTASSRENGKLGGRPKKEKP